MKVIIPPIDESMHKSILGQDAKKYTDEITANMADTIEFDKEDFRNFIEKLYIDITCNALSIYDMT